MSCVFRSERNEYEGIKLWDMSHVKNMHKMFYHNKSFNEDISMWNVSCVEDMRY